MYVCAPSLRAFSLACSISAWQKKENGCYVGHSKSRNVTFCQKKKQQLQQQSLAFQILRRISLAFSKYFVFIALRTRALNLAVIYISLSELRFLSSTSSDNIYPRCPLQRNCRTLWWNQSLQLTSCVQWFTWTLNLKWLRHSFFIL